MTEKAAARKTPYQIFHSSTGRSWEILGSVDASGQESALRAYLNSLDDSVSTEGQWAAVPTRSFQPVNVEPKLVTHHKLQPIGVVLATPPAPTPTPEV